MRGFATPPIHLRTVVAEDAEALANLVDQNRIYLRQWLPWVDRSLTIKDTLIFVHEAHAQKAAGLGEQFGIWWNAKLAGVIGFHSWEARHKRAALGYWLDERAQGRGIMTEAVRILLKDAFTNQGIHRLEIITAITNIRSQRVAERLGFTKEAILSEAEWLRDKPLDVIVFRLLATEWRDKQ